MMTCRKNCDEASYPDIFVNIRLNPLFLKFSTGLIGMEKNIYYEFCKNALRSTMEEELCNIEILKSPKAFIAKIQTDLGGVREIRNQSFEGMLLQLTMDLQEEFDTVL
jgi:hypothetical protein